MRIALVSPYDLTLPGGVQQQVWELHARLTHDGHDSVVVGPGVPEGEPEHAWLSVGRSVPLRGNASRVPVALAPSTWRDTREAVADADVVHVHEPLMPLASLAALWSARPVVSTFHAAAPPWVRTGYRLVAPVLSRRFRRGIVTAVSDVAALAIPRSWGETWLIPNGIETASFRSTAERRDHQVVFLGRDEARKGLDVVLSAWSEVCESVPGAQLVVAGADRTSPDPSIRFEGRVSESRKRELLASSAVFVAPHRGGESFGIVIAEAMAAGCAVVASDLAAFRTVAGDAARFFTTGSSSDLASTLADVLTDDQECLELSRRGLESVRRFDWDRVLRAYVRAYSAAIDAV